MESISHEKDAVNTTQCRIYIRTIIPTNLTFFQIFFFPEFFYLTVTGWLTMLHLQAYRRKILWIGELDVPKKMKKKKKKKRKEKHLERM